LWKIDICPYLLFSLPVIGILERYGLRERAAYVIEKIQAATVGKVTAFIF
jgi:Predicted membrane protein